MGNIFSNNSSNNLQESNEVNNVPIYHHADHQNEVQIEVKNDEKIHNLPTPKKKNRKVHFNLPEMKVSKKIKEKSKKLRKGKKVLKQNKLPLSLKQSSKSKRVIKKPQKTTTETKEKTSK